MAVTGWWNRSGPALCLFRAGRNRRDPPWRVVAWMSPAPKFLAETEPGPEQVRAP